MFKIHAQHHNQRIVDNHISIKPTKEAQLLQLGRMMLRVIDYLAKLLKVIQNNTISRACVTPC